MNNLIFRDIGDDEIRVVRSSLYMEQKPRRPRKWLYIILLIGTLVAIIIVFCVTNCEDSTAEKYIESEDICYSLDLITRDNSDISSDGSKFIVDNHISENDYRLGKTGKDIQEGFTEFVDTLINDIPLRLFIPNNAEMSLHVGKIDKNDSTIIYVAQAADVRADNGKIVGAFVLKGNPVAKGLSKRGFCASINGKVTVGVADNSPLFEEAVEKNGYFFRQYALVDNGTLVENNPKGKSVRRAICNRKEEVFMVESGTKESFHDFAQSLVDLGVENAVYIVGSSAYGWATDINGIRHEFGDENRNVGKRKLTKNVNYIIWRKK